MTYRVFCRHIMLFGSMPEGSFLAGVLFVTCRGLVWGVMLVMIWEVVTS